MEGKDPEAPATLQTTPVQSCGGGWKEWRPAAIFLKLPGDSMCFKFSPASMALPHRGLQTYLPGFVYSGIKLSKSPLTCI